MSWTGRLLIVSMLAAGVAHAQGAPNQRRPYIGFLCAAGGQQGTVIHIKAGGQNLRGVKRVIISGGGVEAKVIRHSRSAWLLRPDDRRVVAQQLRRLANSKLAGRAQDRRQPQKGKGKPGKADPKGKQGKGKQGKGKQGKKGMQKEPPALPDHPMLKNLESLTPRELRRVAYEFLDPARRSQLSPQISEAVLVEVRIAPDAEPGDRELRLGGPLGLSNPVLFQVGVLPEFFEEEPNDYPTSKQPVVELPRVINGQVSFKDLDRFRFRARAGQRLVIETEARRLVPYLADAVPGWFQATLALYDSRGNELRYVDDYRFDPDPVMLFDVPADGEYTLEIRDSIYRGREDFVYRICISERPFITSMFPLGGQLESATTAEIGGWNLPYDLVLLDTWEGAGPVRRSTWRREGELPTNAVTYAVGDLSELVEAEPNDSPRAAQRIELPKTVNGRIAHTGDVDLFRIDGRAGDVVVADLAARRLGSPLDSLVQLTDADGRVLAWNDDHPDKSAGLVTHQADSYVSCKLPASGAYFVRVADTQGHGGEGFAYRLRLSPPRPDFTVITTPASINIPGGGTVPFTAHVVRRDGFDGAVDLALAGAPPDFVLSGGRIPAGRDSVRMTLAAPWRRPGQPIPLRIVGRARIGDRAVERAAVPAEDMMQAFGLRHLVPARELLVDITRSWRRGPPLQLARGEPVRIPAGGTAEVRVVAPQLPNVAKVDFQLSDPPPGITLKKVRAEHPGLVVVLAADREKAKAGLADNLIIEAYAEVEIPPRGPRAKGKQTDKAKKGKQTDKAKGNEKAKQGKRTDKAKGDAEAKGKAKGKDAAKKAPPRTRRIFAGVLPAVPFVVGG